MYKKVSLITVALALLLAVMLAMAPQNALAKNGGKNKGRARGPITAIDTSASTVTILDRGGASVTLNVTSATEIRKDSKKNVPLSGLAVGDKADARYDTTTMNAQRIKAKSPKVEGTITAIDLAAQTVTIQPLSGDAVTVKAVATTKIERNDEHATLADFKIGDRGQARYNATTLEASKIEAEGP
ncbi:MAG: hypothetical protein HY741_15200 [Chloroflexi bacterium]|nr:hypothetical protein [Chloroflexota bacterium]